MYTLISGNKENKTRARRVGAQALVESAMTAHSGNGKVGEEARDLLEQILDVHE
jgi:hypothetical protein